MSQSDLHPHYQMLGYLNNYKDIEQFYIPLVKEAVQLIIAEKIKMAFQLKAESKQLLDLAKHAVEVAIEQDEETALEHINHQTKKLILQPIS